MMPRLLAELSDAEVDRVRKFLGADPLPIPRDCRGGVSAYANRACRCPECTRTHAARLRRRRLYGTAALGKGRSADV